ncbi:MAG: hypothetical protein AL399_08350, partial [Candidatus [Bacteroides] periocalifornicus]
PYQERNSKSCQLIEGDSLLQTYANEAARRVAMVFEKWNCLIKIALHARRCPHERLTHTGLLQRDSLLEYCGLNLTLPFPEGRSDAACRVV